MHTLPWVLVAGALLPRPGPGGCLLLWLDQRLEDVPDVSNCGLGCAGWAGQTALVWLGWAGLGCKA